MRSSLRIYRKTLFRSSEKKVAKVPKISSFHLLYPNKPLSLRCSHADRTGGNRHILKRRLLASCLLWFQTSQLWISEKGDRATIDACGSVSYPFVHLITDAWKLLHTIGVGFNVAYPFSDRQCEGLESWDKWQMNPALFLYMLVYKGLFINFLI